jgi:serine/threonine protein kinase
MTQSENTPDIVNRPADIDCTTTEILPVETSSMGHGWGASNLSCSTEAITLAPGDIVGQYELIRLLGRGGMGEVHLARDLRLGRLVAIKLMNALYPDRNQRFLEEARATARCHHENIVVIHEIGEHQGYPFMVLEYLEGQTLRQWLREHAAAMAASGQPAPVPPCRAIELMLPVVRALAYAHERGIVHRDLKPENILLTRAGTIKVLDFGLAKLRPGPMPDEVSLSHGRAESAEIHCSALIGTLPYMSPEQMKVGVIDHRTDLWAVGIMLFEMVTGAHPVPSRAMGDLLRIAYDETPMPSVRVHMPALGPLSAVIDRCLMKNREHRPPSARALLAELEALVHGRRAAPLGEGGSPFARLAARDAMPRGEQGNLDSVFALDPRTTRRRRWLMAGTLLAVLLVALAKLRPADQEGGQQAMLSQNLEQALQREQAQKRAAEQARREAEAARREAAVQSAGIREDSHSDANLFGVWGTAPDDVSAVGFSGEGGARSGTVLHYDGQSWQQVYALPQGELYGVWVTAPDDVFAVGWSSMGMCQRAASCCITTGSPGSRSMPSRKES